MRMIYKLYRTPHFLHRLCAYFYYKYKLGQFTRSSYIASPLRIDGGKKIYIGKGVIIEYKAWIASTPLTGEKESKLIFEDGCIIGHFNHIYATNSIILHKNVLTADRVYISDNLHGYEDVNTPIKSQPIVQNGTVEIGEGSWLGENVCVLGAKIGKHCVIGANSVVTKDIPDYSVAVGAPAKVIKQFNKNENSWVKINSRTHCGGGKSSYYQNLSLLVA